MNVTLKEERKLLLPRSRNWSLWLHTWCRRSWDRVAHVQSCQCSNVQFWNVQCSNIQALNIFRDHLFRNFINFSRHQKQHLQKHMVAFTKILSWLRTKKIINADSKIYNERKIFDGIMIPSKILLSRVNKSSTWWYLANLASIFSSMTLTCADTIVQNYKQNDRDCWLLSSISFIHNRHAL